MNPTATANLVTQLNGRNPVLTGTMGDVYFVDSGHANTLDATKSGTPGSGRGRTPSMPFATIDYAIGQCTASNGDIIYVAPGHTETVSAASGIDLDVAGITIIGLGNGTNRPTVSFATSTAATIDFSAANCTLKNIRCVNAIDSLASFIEGGAGNAWIEGCEFIGASTLEFICGVLVPTTFDDWTILNCKFIQPTDPAGTNAAAGTGAVYLVDSENVTIEGCEFRGNFETACVHNKTTAALNLWVKDCYGHTGVLTTDMLPFLLVSTATGGARRCHITNVNEAATTEATLSGTFGATFFNFQSFFGNDGGGGQNAIASQSAAS